MKTISIFTVVDVIGALAGGTLNKNIYMIDNNKAGGSADEGTEVLKTMVKKEDRLVWIVLSLEPEAYASITGIDINNDYCNPKMKIYTGTDVTYWVGKVKKDLQSIPYRLKIKVGNQKQELTTPNQPSLIGEINSGKGG